MASPNPDAEMTPAQARMAKARAARAAKKASLTEQVSAPETVTPVAVLPEPPPVVVAPPQQVWQQPQLQPRQMRVERQGARSEPYTRRFPQVRGGICEYCGVIDSNVPSQYQYKLCAHFRGMQLQCSYCSGTKDPDEVVYHSVLNIAEHPDNPSTLVVWCDSYECSKAHIERFQKNRA